MKIGIVGYQGSGKSTLFEYLTGTAADPALAHTTQSAMCPVPEPRIADLCKIYTPK
jgi:ribosome-binding ATPase YchF (GTP1/OBG family)